MERPTRMTPDTDDAAAIIEAVDRLTGHIDEWMEALINAVELALPRQLVVLPSGQIINLANVTYIRTPPEVMVIQFAGGSSLVLHDDDVPAARRALGIEIGTDSE